MDVGEPGGWGNPLSRGCKIARSPQDARVKFLESKWLWHFTQSEMWWSIFEWNHADITSWWRWSRAARCRNSRNRSFFQWPIYSPSLKSSLFLNVAVVSSPICSLAWPARRKVFIRDFQDRHRPFSDDSEAHSRMPRGLSQSDWCAKVVGDPKGGQGALQGRKPRLLQIYPVRERKQFAWY